jgi:predicted ribosome quality control (RQC) complex YloA/Tae2 family protein
MKTWQEFKEDARSFERDKDAYEKETAAKRKLELRRDLAKRKSLNSSDFTKKMQKSASGTKKRFQSQSSDYEQEKDYLNSVKDKEKQIRKATTHAGSSAFNAVARTIKNTSKLVKK